MGRWLLLALWLFYGLVTALVYTPAVRLKPQLLRVIHWGGWGFSLLLLALYRFGHVSLRGEWFDGLAFAATWLAGATYFVLRYRLLSRVSRWYYGSWLFFPGVLGVAYFLAGLLFALLSSPIWLLLPRSAVFTNAECTIRRTGGPLSSGQVVELVTPLGILERHRGRTNRDQATSDGVNLFESIQAAQVLPTANSDSTTVVITNTQGRYRVVFKR